MSHFRLPHLFAGALGVFLVLGGCTDFRNSSAEDVDSDQPASASQPPQRPLLRGSLDSKPQLDPGQREGFDSRSPSAFARR